MCHLDNIVSLDVNHIGWEEDSLLCNLAKTKHEQEGEGVKMSWHIYANPANPYICPVIATALYLFSHPFILTNTSSSFVFTCSNQYKQYTQIWRKAITMKADSFKRVGVDVVGTASHLVWKGVVLMLHLVVLQLPL